MTLSVWTWPDGETLGTLEWEDRIQGLAFDARRGRLLIGAEDCRVVALDQDTLEVVGECAFPSKVHAVEVSRDGEQVAVGRLDGRLSMLAAESLTPLWSSRVSPRGVLNVAFVEPNLVVGTAYDGVVQVLHRSTGNVARILPHQEQLWDVAGSPDGSLIATLERGGHLHLWETRTGRRLEPRHQGREVSVVSFHPAGRRVVTGSWAGTLIEWDCERGRDRHVLGPHIDEATTVAVHPHGRLAVTGGVCGAVRVWDLETGEVVRTWLGHAWHIRAAAFSPDGQSLATGDAARRASVHVRRFPDGEVLHRFDGLGDGVFGLAFLPGGRTLLGAGGDGVLRAWGLEAGTRERELVVSAEPLRAVALHPRGDLVAVAGDSGDISLVDIERWTVRRKLVGHAAGVRGLAFDPTGEVLASAGTDQTTRLWTVSTGAPLRVLTEANPDHGEHTDAIHCVTFHPSGTRLLTGSRTSAIDVWDWRRGALLSTMRGHTGWILALTFSPGGARLLSASTDGTARIWDTRSRSERSAAYAPVARPRAEAARILDARIAEHGDLEAALASLEGDRRLDDEVREEALRAAHGRRGSRGGLRAWAWQALTPPDAEPRRQRAAYAIGHGFARATDIRALPDGEGYLLTGMAEARLKRPHAQYYLERSLDMNAEEPELRVVALLFLSFVLAEEDVADARRRLEAAETLLGQKPAARTRRVETILAEARERFAR
jgi:WD40 repeat protein